jgi:hypothetical protein
MSARTGFFGIPGARPLADFPVIRNLPERASVT